MATIDKLDISVYNLYALRTKMVEQINQEYHLQAASSIPPQTQLMDIYPKLSEMDLLLGSVPLLTPWAYFFPPKHFRFVRRSPFARHRVAPSLGSLEKQEQDIIMLETFECPTPEAEKERTVLLACFSQLDKINSWLGHIMGRMGQFLQG